MARLSRILDQFGRPFALPQRGSVRLRATYDAAQQGAEDSRRHWANADGLSSAAANSEGVRRTLRNRSRYETDNGPYVSGAIRTRADDLVGVGPTLQVLSENDEANSATERLFAGWAWAACLAEHLHTMDQARGKDGEALALLTTNPVIDSPVKLFVKPFEADLLTDPWGGVPRPSAEGNRILDGIEYDRYGNPVYYTVLLEHPGDRTWYNAGPLDYELVPAKYVLHWFRKDRPGQVRGVPELTPSLPLFAYLRRYTLATVSAAEIAADFAGVLESELAGDEDVAPDPFETLEIERGLLMTLPNKNKLHQLKAEQPTTTYPEFKREILTECGRPMRLPSNIVSGDSSPYNYSSAKLDHYSYRGGIRVDRAFAGRNVMDRIFMAWLEEAALVPGYLPRGLDIESLSWGWAWPGWASMDKDNAANDTERLNNGTMTLAEYAGEQGKDWREMIRQRRLERRMEAEADQSVLRREPSYAANGHSNGRH